MRSPATVALAIMAKAPRSGAVKTRLCPPLSPRQAAVAIGIDTPTLDADTPDDLTRLRAALPEDPQAAPATRRVLAGQAAPRRRRATSAR